MWFSDEIGNFFTTSSNFFNSSADNNIQYLQCAGHFRLFQSRCNLTRYLQIVCLTLNASQKSVPSIKVLIKDGMFRVDNTCTLSFIRFVSAAVRVAIVVGLPFKFIFFINSWPLYLIIVHLNVPESKKPSTSNPIISTKIWGLLCPSIFTISYKIAGSVTFEIWLGVIWAFQILQEEWLLICLQPLRFPDL